MPTLTFEIPIAPSVNHCYLNVSPAMRARMTKNGKHVPSRLMTKAGKDYKAVVEIVARAHANAAGFRHTPGERLELHMAYAFARNGSDMDNRRKLAQDAICAGLGVNDKHLTADGSTRLPIDKANPRCEVTVIWGED